MLLGAVIGFERRTVMSKSKKVKHKPIRLKGPWNVGYALDKHTVSSVLNEFGYFDTVRTDMGQLVYELKYARKKSNARRIASAMRSWIRRAYRSEEIDCIVAVPPSASRSYQPVLAIAKRLSEMLSVEHCSDDLKKVRKTKSLKNVLDPKLRRKELSGAFRGTGDFEGKTVLVVDDLYRSGETASEVTLALKAAGATKVFFLAATKTRVNK